MTGRYVLRRLATAVGVLWAAFTVSFVVLYLLPGGATLQAVQYRFSDRPPYSWTVG